MTPTEEEWTEAARQGGEAGARALDALETEEVREVMIDLALAALKVCRLYEEAGISRTGAISMITGSVVGILMENR